MSEENSIRDKSREHFTAVPNLVDEMLLSTYAFRLYFHIKRRAGETGKCWESTENLAKYCRMSTGKVSQAKKELIDARLITIRRKTKNRNGMMVWYHEITINDIWYANAAYYSVTRDKDTDRREIVNDPKQRARFPEWIQAHE